MRQHFSDATIFANKAAEIDQPDVTVYATAYESGAGKTPPKAGVHNYLFNRSDQQHQHIEQNGIPVWDRRTAYAIRGLCLAADGNVYQSLVNNNANADPTKSPGKWEFFCGRDKWLDYLNKINANTQRTRDNAASIKKNTDKISSVQQQLVAMEKKIEQVMHETINALFPPKSAIMREVDPGLAISKGGIGVGNWIQKSGRVPIGAGTYTDPNNELKKFYSNHDYGTYSHTLTVEQMPHHNHGQVLPVDAGGRQNLQSLVGTANVDERFIPYGETEYAGNNRPHPNMQPSFGVGIWYRVS
ncbi:hypothetical protein [Vibrio phage vB_VpM-pA2SJ1]|uniref:Baseplate structural protein Gp10 C-terminal domain-containing protein n=1 Tax=Vibrio phage vB_VpM-pA2SJ1 TaxID=3095964 RepID=A0AAX4J5D6_9CAUD